MSWTSKLKTPMALKDGRMLETLADARAVILGMSEDAQLSSFLAGFDLGHSLRPEPGTRTPLEEP
jgi:hypothetical protein